MWRLLPGTQRQKVIVIFLGLTPIPEFICLALLPHLSYTAPMKSLTIRLPESLARRIEQQSTARRVSKSSLIRDLLDQPSLPPLNGGGLREILEECWAMKVPVRRRRALSPKKQRLLEIIRAKKLHR